MSLQSQPLPTVNPLHPLLKAQLPALASTWPAVANLLAVVAQLRNPNGGCPWDLAQTHESLRPHLLEEAYEAVEAMTPSIGSPSAMKEELGDVLLQVVLNAQLAQEAGQFNFNDICQTLSEKLIRRHPHVFNAPETSTITTPAEVSQQWQAIKATEKAQQGNAPAAKPSALMGVNEALPALNKAASLSKKAVKVGFKWPNDEALWACVLSEFNELKAEADAPTPNTDALEDELGDVFFACATLAQHYNLNPEVALTRAIHKFKTRFVHMEQHTPKPLEALSLDEWEALWQQAKIALAQNPA
jgi:MazG family protein